jgi:hypothetical protein
MVGNIALVKDHRLSIWVPYMAFLVQNTVCNTSVCVCVCVCVRERERQTEKISSGLRKKWLKLLPFL